MDHISVFRHSFHLWLAATQTTAVHPEAPAPEISNSAPPTCERHSSSIPESQPLPVSFVPHEYPPVPYPSRATSFQHLEQSHWETVDISDGYASHTALSAPGDNGPVDYAPVPTLPHPIFHPGEGSSFEVPSSDYPNWEVGGYQPTRGNEGQSMIMFFTEEAFKTLTSICTHRPHFRLSP
jgi:hypothetical protein